MKRFIYEWRLFCLFLEISCLTDKERERLRHD